MNLTSKRYLGLELSGAKNQKTSLAAIEYYPKEKKTFLLDIFDRISAHSLADSKDSGSSSHSHSSHPSHPSHSASHAASHNASHNETSDEALLATIEEMNSGVAKIGVNVPLELPPCIRCTRKSCPLPAHCTVSAVSWMREATKEVARASGVKSSEIRPFTPYTQRPIELWMRYGVFPRLPESHRFEIDEALGGSRAPLTARMSFLRRHLLATPLVEVWPKMTIAILSARLDIHKRIVSTYRHLEEGPHSREVLLTALAKKYEIFIYERDLRKLSQSLTAFDAFLCAFTALLSDLNLCTKTPKGFPASSGWVQYPRTEP